MASLGWCFFNCLKMKIIKYFCFDFLVENETVYG